MNVPSDSHLPSQVGAGVSQSGAGLPETIRFPVAGMTCGSCVARVTRALKRLEGVERVRVDLADEAAFVRRRPGIATDQLLAAAVAEAGYEARLDQGEPADPRETVGLLGRLLSRAS